MMNRWGPSGGGSGGAGSSAVQPQMHEVQFPPDDCISSVKFAPVNSPVPLIGATSWDRTVRVWQLQQQGSTIQSQPMGIQNHSQPLLDVSFSGDGRAFYGGCCCTGMMWDLSSNAVQQVAAHDLPVSCLSFVEMQGMGQMLITASWDGSVRFWDLRQAQPAKEEKLGGPIFAMDATTAPMVTFALGRRVVVYDLQSMRIFNNPLEPNNLMKFQFRTVSNWKDCRGVLVGSADGRVAAHPLEQKAQTLACCFKAHADESTAQKNHFTMYQVNFAKVHPCHGTVFTGGSDGRIRVWNILSKTRIGEIAAKQFSTTPIPIAAGDISGDGQMIGFARSYDWSMGKDGFNPQMPRSINIMAMQDSWIKTQ